MTAPSTYIGFSWLETNMPTCQIRGIEKFQETLRIASGAHWMPGQAARFANFYKCSISQMSGDSHVTQALRGREGHLSTWCMRADATTGSLLYEIERPGAIRNILNMRWPSGTHVEFLSARVLSLKRLEASCTPISKLAKIRDNIEAAECDFQTCASRECRSYDAGCSSRDTTTITEYR
jgi:hypothetical protein